MRYPKHHKEQTRTRIVDSAAVAFRRDGLSGAGVKRIMLDSGLTHGGFYAHFASRDELIAEALDSALDATHASLARAVQAADPERRTEAFIDSYLSALHRDRTDKGCAGAALAAEVARETPQARANLLRGLERIVTLLASTLPDAVPRTRRRNITYAAFGGMMGTLQLARLADDPALSRSLLQAGRQAARTLLLDTPGS